VSPPAATALPGADLLPARAPGVELLGELAGSGYQRAPGLVRRADGQTLQLTPLLYRLLEELDGFRTEGELAQRLGQRVERDVTADDVRFLLERLRPLGVLRDASGAAPVTEKANPVLALRFKVVVADPAVTWRLTTPFARLFSPWVVVPVLAAFVATCWWVLFEKGLAAPTRAALYEPGMLLAVIGLTIASAGFHEFGHAAACRYGGARPGAMGAGVYLVWPAFYTDVDDSYRLSRWGRLRVDLGGLYFNALVAVAVTGAWLVWRHDALLLVVGTQLLQMLRQLAPFLRADGYHLLADLTGVPDLFAHLRSTLLGMLPRRWRPAVRTPLKRWARVVVTAWVLLVVPVLLGLLVLAVVVLPRLAATAWDSAGLHARGLAAAAGDGDVVRALALLLSLIALAIPVLGICYLLGLVTRRTTRSTWRLTEGRPRARAAAVMAGAVLALLVAWAWWPAAQYEPLRADERGTLASAVEQLTARPSVVPLTDPDPESVGAAQPAPVVAAQARPVRAAAAPARQPLGPAVQPVRLRSALPAAPAVGPAVPRVIRFALPAPPGEGDNQALALGDRDGKHVYEGAYALIYVTDGSAVRHRNTAYALASCIGCSTSAVAFQVVLVVGDSRIVVPINEAAAGNERCLSCVTTALAVQVVASLESLPDGRTAAALKAAMAPLQGLQGRSVQLGPTGLLAEVKAVEAQVLAVLAGSGLVRTGPPTTTSDADREVVTAAVAAPLVSPSPSAAPSLAPPAEPGVTPAAAPGEPADPSAAPSTDSFTEPTTEPSTEPTAEPTAEPAAEPSAPPTSPEPEPTPQPTPAPDEALRTEPEDGLVAG
jgi:putative peptide zinc metalloprotease protein